MSILFPAVFGNALAAALLAVIVIVVGRLWRRPAVLHLLWLLVLIKLITPPIVGVSIHWPPYAWGQPATEGIPHATEERTVAQAHPGRPPEREIHQGDSENAKAVALPEYFNTTSPSVETTKAGQVASTTGAGGDDVAPAMALLKFVVLIGWSLGAVLYVMLVIWRVLAFRRILKQASRAPEDLETMAKHLAKAMGIRQNPPILMLEGKISPAVWPGWRRPIILLPRELLDSLAPEKQQSILAHELAHIRRKDHWVRILEIVVAALYWWHPVVWFARRQLHELEEQCCDIEVVSVLSSTPRDYALALVQTLEFLMAGHTRPPITTTGMRPTSSLRKRLHVIMDSPGRLRLPFLARCGLAVIAALALSISPLALSSRQETKDGPAAGSSSAGRVDPERKPRLDLHGDPLPLGAIARAGSIRFRPGDVVWRVAFSNDGKQVFTWSGRGSFSVWEAKSGKLIQRHDFARTTLHILSVFPDGRSLAVLQSSDDQIHLWDFTAAKPPKVGVGPNMGAVAAGDDSEEFSRFAVSAGGDVLAGGTAGLTERRRMIQLWRLAPGKTLPKLKKIRQLPRVMGDIRWLEFSQDGSNLISICRERGSRGTRIGEKNVEPYTAYVWEAATGKLRRKFPCQPCVQQGANRAVVLSPMGTTLVVGGSDNMIYAYDIATGKQILRMESSKQVHCLAFSKSGRWLVSGGRDMAVRLWDMRTGKERRSFQGHRSWVESVAISGDEKTIVSGSQDNTVRRWDVESGREIRISDGHQYRAMSLALSADGRLLVTGGSDGVVHFWEGDTGKRINSVKWPNMWVNSLALSPDGKQLAVGGSGGEKTLRLLEAPGGKQIRAFEGQGEIGFNSLTFSADGKWLLAGGGRKGGVHQWDVATGARRRSVAIDEPRVRCVAISPQDDIIAAAGSSRQAGSYVIRLWSSQTGKLLKTIRSEKGGVESLAFSPDGKRMVTGGWSSLHGFTGDGRNLSSEGFRDSVQLWDISTEKVLAKFPGQPYLKGGAVRIVNDVAFSPNGRLIATAERSGQIVFYDIKTKKQVALAKHNGPVRVIRFSADGRRLASVSLDTTALVWDVQTLLAQGKK